MSIKIMSAIFETEFRDLPLPPKEYQTKVRLAKASSLKLVMLAIADHANDEGISAYPGLTLLERKTSLSRRGLINVLSALKTNGLLVVSDQPSHLGTNDYSVILSSFPCIDDASKTQLLVKPLHQGSEATSPALVKPLHHNHPLITNKPIKHTSNEIPDFINLTVQQAASLPELQIFREATGRIPGQGQYETIWATIRKMNGTGTAKALHPYWLEWCARGYNENSLNWITDWALNGEIPPKMVNRGRSRPAKGDNTEFFKNLEIAAQENNTWLPEKKLLKSSAT